MSVILVTKTRLYYLIRIVTLSNWVVSGKVWLLHFDNITEFNYNKWKKGESKFNRKMSELDVTTS